MLEFIKGWYQRYFSHPDANILFFSLLFLGLLIGCMGRMLAPVFVGLSLAYLLQSVVKLFRRLKCPKRMAAILTFLLFLAALFALFSLFPLLYRQLESFLNAIPHMLAQLQTLLLKLPERYPDLVTSAQITDAVAGLKHHMGDFAQSILSISLSSLTSAVSWIVYLVLVPLLVYFFLVDRDLLLQKISTYLPQNRRLLTEIWSEINSQIWNYVQGKVIELILVAAIAVVLFMSMGLSYPLILGLLVGVSVIIPYVGAVLVTIPVVLVGFLQWGMTPHFYYLLLAYFILITLDANLLVPLLFSELMKLHPVIIILSVLVFGGLWGFWGIFFAIPLATTVRAIVHAWPKVEAV